MDTAFEKHSLVLLFIFKHAFKKLRCYQKLNKEMRTSFQK